jgi:diguanylate cyclase (GGDEF)-like protein
MHTPARLPLVLFVTRTRWLVQSFESILAPNGYQVVRVGGGDEAVRVFSSIRPDMVLIETELAEDTDLDTCRLLRAESTLGPRTPIVLVCPRVPSRSVRLEAIRAGAWEVFSFPFDGEEMLLKLGLFAAVRGEVERVEEQGMLDPWTGLYNARGVVRRAQELTAEAQRHQLPLACVVVGVGPADEAQGPGGERVEQWVSPVAEVIRRVARESDAVGRLRGAEFVILTPHTGWFGARRLVARLVEELEALAASTAGFDIYTGCHAIEEFPESPLQPVHLVVQGMQSLRKAQMESEPRARTEPFSPAARTAEGAASILR